MNLSGSSPKDTFQNLVVIDNNRLTFTDGTGSAVVFPSASFSQTASFALNGGGSGTTLFTASTYPITSSWSQTSSVALISLQAPAATLPTASVYQMVTTSSANWITASFFYSEQYSTITLGALYNFTCSDIPQTGNVSNLSLFINNTAVATSSLSFPSNWTFIGIVPTFLTASKSALLSLKAFNDRIIAAWGSQY